MRTKMFKMLLTRSLSFAAILMTGTTFAFAEPVLDLAVPQTGNFPSVLDLSNGKGGEWGKMMRWRVPTKIRPLAAPKEPALLLRVRHSKRNS
jgi:hypothetical protein